MKIDIISDTHFDLHLDKDSLENTEEFLQKVFIKTGSNVLIIAGDLGHFNSQNIAILKLIKELYEYKYIICILGNHDYYLIDKIQEKQYERDSFKRAEEMRELINAEDGMYCLDGDVVEIDGIRFGGCSSWYDGSYFHRTSSSYGRNVITFWKQTMNDAKMIKGIEDFYDMFKIQREKLDVIYQQCDIIITHVNPSIYDKDMPPSKRDDKMNAFYSFCGDEWLDNTTAKYWIYGHNHVSYEYKRDRVSVICNALGYPAQLKDFKIRTVEI
ncbi:metallophosphoesterase [Sulfurimonas sp.]|uniref:metallophosphoesterase family protein n=1 Tax=Sulfurimonas sp. TaxID=2022749 RepID=UPI001A0A8905|nr:metallophosphoesterase [Sulfurimonas sp.]MBE0515121.1 metallophosphoesterase [Sulfurimonas sp.]